MGVAAGDTVQFRFDIGRDGCGGNDGWYVDNVQVDPVQAATKTDRRARPEPSTFGTASSVNVTVERDGNGGPAPTGDVNLNKADGTVVGTATLARRQGHASPCRPTSRSVSYTMTASYAARQPRRIDGQRPR